MKDIHKSPNDNSTELREFKSNQLEQILLDFAKQDNNSSSNEKFVEQYMVKNSLKYKKVKDTFGYYSNQESIRLHIARSASKILEEQFNVGSAYTCYTYWTFKYRKYSLRIKYIKGEERYSITHSNCDGKFNFQTDSFKEFFLKIKSLN